MLQASKWQMWAFALVGVLVLARGTDAAFAQGAQQVGAGFSRTTAPAIESDSAKVVNQYPEALVYFGLNRIAAGDTLGAISAWARYIEIAPDGDTTAVRQLINDALVPQAVLDSVETSVTTFLKKEMPRLIRELPARGDLVLAESKN